MTDSQVDVRRFWILPRVDIVSRVSPAIEVGISLNGERMFAVLV